MRVQFGEFTLEEYEGELTVTKAGESRTVGSDNALFAPLCVLYGAANGGGERVPKKAPDGAVVGFTTVAEAELAIQLSQLSQPSDAPRAAVCGAANNLVLAITSTDRGSIDDARAALVVAIAKEVFASPLLSSALRRNSLDFRVDGEVRCKLGFEENKATFSGAGGAKVALGGLADPIHEHEAATKHYVDSVASGLTVKGSVHYVVTSNLAAEYGAHNGADNMQLVGNKSFAELDASLFDLDLENGGTVGEHTNESFIASGDELVATKFLVNAQLDNKQNGVYFLAEAAPRWVLQRYAGLFDASAGAGALKPGSFVFVERGHRKANHGFVLVSNAGQKSVPTRGDAASAVKFEQFSGAGQLSAGTNVSKIGDTINLNPEIAVSLVETEALRVTSDAAIQGRLAVSGATYVGGDLEINAGGAAPGAQETSMRIEKKLFRVRVGTDAAGEAAQIDVADGRLRIGGVQAVLLAGGGFRQESDASYGGGSVGRNVFCGHTIHRRPMLIERSPGAWAFDDVACAWTTGRSGHGDAMLVVDGKTYVDGALFVSVSETRMALKEDAFVVQVTDKPGGLAGIGLGDGAFTVEGADVQLKSGAIVQAGAEARNVLHGHTRHLRPLHVASVAGELEYDAANSQWTGKGGVAVTVTPGGSDDFTGASLVVEGKAYVDGPLVVAGEGGAQIHGRASLDGALSVRGGADIQGQTFVGCGPLRADGTHAQRAWGMGASSGASAARTSSDAALVVGGKTYVDGGLVVNAGGTDASAGMLLDANAFQLGVPNGDASLSGGFACIELGTDLVIEGVRELCLRTGGIRQTSATTRNIFGGDVELERKLLVGGAARLAEMVQKRGDAKLLVDGGAYVAGKLNLEGGVECAGTARFVGDCHARCYYSHSDAGLKRDVRRIDGAVAQCQKLRGVEFKWLHGNDERDQIGCIAQEVEDVYPSLVSEENGHKSVDYAKLVGLLIEAVKELKAEIVELRAERAPRAPER